MSPKKQTPKKRVGQVVTILSDVKSHESFAFSDKDAAEILAILDEWIDDCEREGEFYAGSGDAPAELAEHRQIAAEYLDSIASLKRYRRTIQTAGQSWWALAMMRAARTATMSWKLSRETEQFVRTAWPRLKKYEKAVERRGWLKNRIEEHELTFEDLLGRGKKPKRAELFDEYHKKWIKSSRTLTADLKELFRQLDVKV